MSEQDGDQASEGGSIDCFQNYTASEVFIQGLAGVVDQVDVESMIRAQKQMLQRFEKTNEMLNNCNMLSTNRLKTATTDLKRYTTMLLAMKKDLNSIFKRTKNMRERIAQTYPLAYQEACKVTTVVSPTESEAEARIEDTNKEEIPEFASSSSDSPSSKPDDESTSSDTG